MSWDHTLSKWPLPTNRNQSVHGWKQETSVSTTSDNRLVICDNLKMTDTINYRDVSYGVLSICNPVHYFILKHVIIQTLPGYSNVMYIILYSLSPKMFELKILCIAAQRFLFPLGSLAEQINNTVLIILPSYMSTVELPTLFTIS